MTKDASSPTSKLMDDDLYPAARLGAYILLVAFHVCTAVVLAAIPRDSYPDETEIFLGIGIITAQASLLGCWAGLGPWRFAVRIPSSLGAAMLLWLVMYVFLVEIGGPNGVEAIVFSALLVFAQYTLVASAGFLLRRSTGRWLARNDHQPSSAVSSRQFSIKQMMLWTTGIALLLAIGRFLVPDTFQFGRIDEEMVVAFLMLAAFSLATVLPALLLSMLDRLPWIVAAVVLVPITGLVTALEFVAFVLLLGPGGEIWIFLVMNASILITIVATQGVMRLCGYRLRLIPGSPAAPLSGPEIERSSS